MGTDVVCGLDVHRSLVVASLRAGGRAGETREFRTDRSSLLELKTWLCRQKCQVVGMEATGVYWRPVYRILEGGCRIVVANPQHIKVMKGRKTDRADAAWIARKLEDEDSFIPSFVPGLKVRETREVVRFRENLIKGQTQIRNEIQKLLAGAGVPIKACISDLFGVSGLGVLEKLAAGECAWDCLPGLLHGKLRKAEKLQALRLALEMPLTEAQRWELSFQLERHRRIGGEIAKVEARLADGVKEEGAAIARLVTIPGIGIEGARLLVGFFGTDLSGFPNADHFASWIGLVPGNNESGGKSFKAKRKKGCRFLQGKFTQFAQGAAMTKGSWLQAKYRSLCGRMPKGKAIGAIAHKLALIVYHVLKDGNPYQDRGQTYLTAQYKARQLRRAIALIERNGMTVHSDISADIK